jgi:hypothetical protein
MPKPSHAGRKRRDKRMNPTIAKLAKRILLVVSWVLIVLGTLSCGDTIAAAYMLLSGQVSPGEPYSLSDLTPTVGEALMDVLISAMFLVVGFVVRDAVTRRRDGSPLTDNSR